jgi:predicted nuclease of restriction endonuclease-like (RecB) superfamily
MESDHLPIQPTAAYRDWLLGLKKRFKSVQLKSAVKVNQELLTFYWELGQEIVEKQQHTDWGSGFLKHLSRDLIAEFPEIKGFSYRNLKRIRQWVLFYSKDEDNLATACGQISANPPKSPQTIDDQGVANWATSCGPIVEHHVPQVLTDLISIPWGHNGVIISKCSSIKEALYYVRQTLAHGWSRAVLVHQIESDLFSREGSTTSNFAATLPPAQSDLARQTLKDRSLQNQGQAHRRIRPERHQQTHRRLRIPTHTIPSRFTQTQPPIHRGIGSVISTGLR